MSEYTAGVKAKMNQQAKNQYKLKTEKLESIFEDKHHLHPYKQSSYTKPQTLKIFK